MAQMKEKNKTPEKELNETKRVNLSDAKFKTLVIRMLRDSLSMTKAPRRNEGYAK